MRPDMPIAARRVFRLSLTMALALAGAYGLALPLPYLAPLFALVLTAAFNSPAKSSLSICRRSSGR